MENKEVKVVNDLISLVIDEVVSGFARATTFEDLLTKFEVPAEVSSHILESLHEASKSERRQPGMRYYERAQKLFGMTFAGLCEPCSSFEEFEAKMAKTHCYGYSFQDYLVAQWVWHFYE